MSALFLKLLNMSITASWLVLAVILLRILLKKAPKAMRCALWILVGIRLILPFSFESVLSLVPSAQTVPQEIIYSSAPSINSGITVINHTINPILSQSLAPDPAQSVNPMQIVTAVASYIWFAGVSVMLIYCMVSYCLLRRKTREAVETEKGILICDRIDSPFILGVIRPRIYLPCGIESEDAEYVIAHERAHLRRRDHLWKPLGFALLSIYWFNPVIWVAYVLLCRDIEFACDEKVIRELGTEVKKPYSEALINCSIPRRRISACPLAFGEVGVDKRIRSVLSYKKPAFWIIILAIVLSVVAAVCLLTDPKEKEAPIEQSAFSDLEGLSIEIVDIENSAPSPYIEVKWQNNSGKNIVYGDPFYIYQDKNGEWIDCNKMSHSFSAIGYLLPDGQSASKKYSLSFMQMEEPGLYRFDSDCLIDGGDTQKYKLWIDFELKEPVEGIEIRQLEATLLVGRPILWDDVEWLYPPELPRFRIINGKYFLSWEENQWEARGDLKSDKLTAEIWDEELNGVRWVGDNTAEDIRTNNKKTWIIDSGESEGNHFFYILLEQNDGSCYVASGNYSLDSGSKIIAVYLAEEAVSADPAPSYNRTIALTEYAMEYFDIDGDGAEEICKLSACPELETFSFVFSVIEMNSSNSVYDYMSVFQCEGADEAIFTEMNGRLYVQTHDPAHPAFPYDDIYTLWEIDIDGNGNLRLSFDGGKQIMTSYSENSLVLNDNGDIIYAGNLCVQAPPSLSVSAGGSSLNAWLGAWSCKFSDEDGRSRYYEADNISPLENLDVIRPWCINLLSYDGSGEAYAELIFDIQPDELTVECIDADDPDAKKVSIETDGTRIKLKPGLSTYAYHIIAKWDNSEFSGTADYAFCTGMSEFDWYDYSFKHDFMSDIDGDGITEYCVAASGNTADFFTFTVGACDEDKVIDGFEGTAFLPGYPCHVSLVQEEDGYYLGIAKEGSDAIYLYKIGVDESTGRITLYCEAKDEYMPYWEAILNTSNNEVKEYPYTPVIDTISGDINGDGFDESCTLSVGPTSGVFSFYLSINTIISSSNGYKSLFAPFSYLDIGFSERDGSIYLCCKDENDGEINYLVGIDSSTETITLTREDNGEIIYGAKIIPSLTSE